MQNVNEIKEEIRRGLEIYLGTVKNGSMLEPCDDFLYGLARDNYYSKMSIRNLFRNHPDWNEEKDCIIYRTKRVEEIDEMYLRDKMLSLIQDSSDANEKDERYYWFLCSICTCASDKEVSREVAFNKHNISRPDYSGALDKVIKGFLQGTKLTRVIGQYYRALGLEDDTAGSAYNKAYAEICDLIAGTTHDVKIIVSINPAHQITMSNPKRCKQGEMLTSCHSLNQCDSDDHSYCSGAIGCARDSSSIIVFEVSDPDNKWDDTYYRKTSREMYFYNDGVILQSRLYTSQPYGGTDGVQPMNKVYREAVQSIIATCLKVENRWITKKYPLDDTSDIDCTVTENYGYGGYDDWNYSSYDCHISHLRNYNYADEIEIGEYSLCVNCGKEIRDGVLCDDCKSHSSRCCVCGEGLGQYDSYIGADDYTYCEECYSERFAECKDCGCVHDNDDLVYVENHGYVCESCKQDYTYCDCCDCYHDDTVEFYHVKSSYGQDTICEHCIENKWQYKYCEKCDTWYDLREYMHCPGCDIALISKSQFVEQILVRLFNESVYRANKAQILYNLGINHSSVNHMDLYRRNHMLDYEEYNRCIYDLGTRHRDDAIKGLLDLGTKNAKRLYMKNRYMEVRDQFLTTYDLLFKED